MKRKMSGVEILVVFGVIAILALVLLPTHSGAISRQARIKCHNNLKQIAFACQLYAKDNLGSFPLGVGADDSNDSFYLLLPKYLTATKTFICEGDAWREHFYDRGSNKPVRSPARTMTKDEFDAPNVVSYAYVGGLTEKSNSDSPLGGDNLKSPSKANKIDEKQFDNRSAPNQGGGSHESDGGIVVFVDGHAGFNPGTTLKTRWVDGFGGTEFIQNPNGLQ